MLSDLVLRSGGLLPNAFGAGARFFRSLDDAGRVNIELPSALANPGGRSDVLLQPGDSIHVPEYQATVRVRGAVLSPIAVLYQELALTDLDMPGFWADGLEEVPTVVGM